MRPRYNPKYGAKLLFSPNSTTSIGPLTTSMKRAYEEKSKPHAPYITLVEGYEVLN